MKLNITISNGQTWSIDVSDEAKLKDLKALCAIKTSIVAEKMSILLNGNVLAGNDTSLSELGIKDGDMLLVQTDQPQQNAMFKNELTDQTDSKAQKIIEEEIRRQQIDSNLEYAIEHFPETFGEVAMLYIDCKVNGHAIKALVDTGAQCTVMNKACIERCNILNMVDSQWTGTANGIGTERFIGRVNSVKLEINEDSYDSSIYVLEKHSQDLIIGLDLLLQYQCCIDLKSNTLRIGKTGKQVRFLPEGEIPKLGNSESDLQKALQNCLPSIVPASRTNKYPEAVIKELTDLGFTQAQVVAELDAFHGDKDQALASLLDKSIKSITMPPKE